MSTTTERILIAIFLIVAVGGGVRDAHAGMIGKLNVGARFALPKCAAALSLRAHVTMPGLAAPDSDVDAMAEVAASEAFAWALGSQIEGCESHRAIVISAG